MIRVRDDLLRETFSLFVASETSSWLMYCCGVSTSVLHLGCWDMTVGLSAYEMSCVLRSKGDGTWCMLRLKSVDESTEPYGSPFLKCVFVEGLPLCSVYACLPKRTLASHFFKLGCMLALKIFWLSRWRGTVAKALRMSTVAIGVLCAGFWWFKPSMMFCVRCVRSVLVQWQGLKLCCVGERGMWELLLLKSNHSSIFDSLQRKKIWR